MSRRAGAVNQQGAGEQAPHTQQPEAPVDGDHAELLDRLTAQAERGQAHAPLDTLPHLAPPKSGRRTGQVAEALKRYISLNHLPAGTRLPTERELADTLLVGRNLVREALNSLVALGLVEKRQGSGIYVRGFDADHLAEQLSYGLREAAVYWRHLFEARVELEVMIAPLVARRITSEGLARLSDLLDTMRRTLEQGQSQVPPDFAFHQALTAYCGNPVLERIGRTIISEHFRYTASLSLGLVLVGTRETISNHEPLLAALAARDEPASTAAMRYHFRRIQELMAQAGGVPEQDATAAADRAE
jgi:GntR family transcriptional regulator, transcriptional repressor for pyruvate dehydrogenase complex